MPETASTAVIIRWTVCGIIMISRNPHIILSMRTGDIHEDGADTRIACTKIRLEKRLSTEAFVAHALLYMAEHPYLETSSIVMNETVHGEARNGFWLVRGKNPKCSAPIGTVVGMAQEAANSKEIISMTVYRVDGEKYRPDAVYLVDGKEIAP